MWMLINAACMDAVSPSVPPCVVGSSVSCSGCRAGLEDALGQQLVSVLSLHQKESEAFVSLLSSFLNVDAFLM